MKTWLSHGSRIWPQWYDTRRQRPMRALVSFAFQRNVQNMWRTQLLGHSPHPACSGWPAGFISTCFYSYKVLLQMEVGTLYSTRNHRHLLQRPHKSPSIVSHYTLTPFYPLLVIQGLKIMALIHKLLNLSNAEATFIQSARMKIFLKTILTLSCWYSLDSSCWILSDEYPFARLSVIY